MKIYTNATKKIRDESKFSVSRLSCSEMIKKVKKSQTIYLDTETAAVDFNDDYHYLEFIKEHKNLGKKVTKVTEKSAATYAEKCRGEYALDPYRSEVRIVQIATDIDEIFIFDNWSIGQDLTGLFKAISGMAVCGQNFKFDLKVIRVNYPDYFPGEIFDTQAGMRIDQYATTIGKVGARLYEIVKEYCDVDLAKGYGAGDWRKPITSEQFDYCVEDVLYLKECSDKMINNLNHRSTNTVPIESSYFNGKLFDKVSIIEMKFVAVLADIELAGVPINKEVLKAHLIKLQKELNQYNFTFKDVNTRSPIQLMDFLEKHKVYVTSTAKSELVKHKNHKIVHSLIEVKRLQKEIQMVDDYLNLWCQVDGKIYGGFNQQRASSGRMSAYQPNLQQIPRAIKDIFYAKNKGIIKADYPAIEARIAAVICNDFNMLKIFKGGEDIHLATTVDFLKKPKEEITKEERQIGKSANFGLMFGMGAKAYCDYCYTNFGMKVSIEEAMRIRASYFKSYPGIKKFHNQNSERLQGTDYGLSVPIFTKTLLGRISKVDSFTNANNYPIQGTAAEMLKLASNLFYDKCLKKKINAHIINIVHDELVVQINNKKDKKMVKLYLKSAMETAANYILKIIKTEVEVENV